MANSGEQFKMAMAAWAKRAGGKLDALASQTSQEMAQRVHSATPVDTGNLKGNWQPSIGQPGATASGSAQKYGASDIGAVATGMKAGLKFFFINNTVYARRLEYGFVGPDSLGRVYNQKGRFFVRNTVRQWKKIVQQVAAELKIK